VSARTLDRIEHERAPTATVDPRIQARRDEVERDRHRRRRVRLAVVAAVVVLAGLVYAVTHSALLDVDRVVVQATDHVPADELVAAAQVRAGQPLIDVDPGAVRSRILQALPWVADARVEVDWRAGNVTVAVTERIPAAAVPDGAGGWGLIDGTGRTVAAIPGGDPGVMPIEGVAPVLPGHDLGPGAQAPLQLIAMLQPGLRSRIAAIVVASDGSLELKARPQGIVRLCQPVQLEAKLRSLTTLFAQVDDTGLVEIGVCDPTRPTEVHSP
jgi:cell division protein FtsQ